MSKLIATLIAGVFALGLSFNASAAKHMAAETAKPAEAKKEEKKAAKAEKKEEKKAAKAEKKEEKKDAKK